MVFTDSTGSSPVRLEAIPEPLMRLVAKALASAIDIEDFTILHGIKRGYWKESEDGTYLGTIFRTATADIQFLDPYSDHRGVRVYRTHSDAVVIGLRLTTTPNLKAYSVQGSTRVDYEYRQHIKLALDVAQQAERGARVLADISSKSYIDIDFYLHAIWEAYRRYFRVLKDPSKARVSAVDYAIGSVDYLRPVEVTFQAWRS